MIFASATPDARRLILAAALRGFVNGSVSVYLAGYLQLLGFSAFQVGATLTAMLVGSAVMTLGVGLAAHRVSARQVLFGAAALMLATGIGFAFFTNFWLVLVVAFLGTLNPGAADVSVFLPAEQSILAGEVEAAKRTALFARYSLAGALFGAFGALASPLPAAAAARFGVTLTDAFRAGFVVYALAALAIVALYRGLKHGRTPAADTIQNAPLRRSRPIVLRLTALFALDSFGGGFAIDSLLVLWLFLRFDLSLQVVGTVFFAARTLSALSQLVSPHLAARYGLIETMVFTHIPANIFLILAAF